MGMTQQVTRQNIARLLAAAFVDRVRRTGIKGKKTRDAAALEFFVGAAVALSISGQHELAGAVHVALSFAVTVRGYKAVEEMAQEQMTRESVALNVAEAKAERASRVCVDCYSTEPEPHATNCPTKQWTT